MTNSRSWSVIIIPEPKDMSSATNIIIMKIKYFYFIKLYKRFSKP
jgi:hypothetical protein